MIVLIQNLLQYVISKVFFCDLKSASLNIFKYIMIHQEFLVKIKKKKNAPKRTGEKLLIETSITGNNNLP
jgi:hypothetical protein